MIAKAITSLLVRQLLRIPVKLATQLGWTKLIHSTGAKLAAKPGAVHTTAAATQHPRRKRSTAPPSVSQKQSVLNPQRLPQYQHTRISLRAKVLASFERTQPVVTMSISDFRLAVERVFSGPEKLTPSVDDEAILNTLERAKFKHDMVADSKVIQERLESIMPPAQASASGVSTEHEIIRTQLESENDKREMLGREAMERLTRVGARDLKRFLFKVANAARRGERPDVYVPPAERRKVAAWVLYEMRWKAIRNGNVRGLISLKNLPYPGLALPGTLSQYELFVLSPVRPGYGTCFMTERLAKERELWDESHVLEKVVPLCDEQATVEVLRRAQIVRSWLDVLVAKYDSCELPTGYTVFGDAESCAS